MAACCCSGTQGTSSCGAWVAIKAARSTRLAQRAASARATRPPADQPTTAIGAPSERTLGRCRRRRTPRWPTQVRTLGRSARTRVDRHPGVGSHAQPFPPGRGRSGRTRRRMGRHHGCHGRVAGARAPQWGGRPARGPFVRSSPSSGRTRLLAQSREWFPFHVGKMVGGAADHIPAGSAWCHRSRWDSTNEMTCGVECVGWSDRWRTEDDRAPGHNVSPRVPARRSTPVMRRKRIHDTIPLAIGPPWRGVRWGARLPQDDVGPCAG